MWAANEIFLGNCDDAQVILDRADEAATEVGVSR